MTAIRFAESADIPALVRLVQVVHAESRFASVRFSSKRVWDVLSAAVDNRGSHCVIVAAGNAGIVGLLYASIDQYLFGLDLAVQVDLVYVTPPLRGTPVAMRMLGALRRWADNRKAAEIWMADRFGAHGSYNRRLFERLELQPVGTVHARWLDRPSG